MRPTVLVLAWCLAGCDRPASDRDADGVAKAPSVPDPADADVIPRPREASAPAPAQPGSLALHVVATRRGPLAIEVDESMELLRATAEIVELRSQTPLAREPRFLAGMADVVEDYGIDGTGLWRLGARWPHLAILVVDIPGDEDGIAIRSALWDGSRWRRDDTWVGDVRRMHVPIGPYTFGTLLTRVEGQHLLDGAQALSRLRRVRAKTFMRRSPDGTERAGPRLPPWPNAEVASSTSGHVFAGGHGRIAVWSPELGTWTTSEPPGASKALVEGFRVFAADDVIAFGSRDLTDESAWLAHWDGARWSAVPGPACIASITRVARHDGRVWVLCSRVLEDPPITHEAKAIWVGDGAGRWTNMALARDADERSRFTAGAVASADAWAPDGMAATDLASTRDGTLWMLVRGELDEHDERKVQRWLVRSGPQAPPLELPTDEELEAAIAQGR